MSVTSSSGTTSRLIAGLIGPVMVAMGIGLLLNRATMPAMAEQLTQNHGLVFLAGLLSLVAGVAIVRAHNVWSGGWPVIVTIFGWLAIIGGLFRMWFPQLAEPIAHSFAANSTPLLIAGIVMIALGAFLSMKAYT